MKFRLDVEHWEKPTLEEKWCVQPGDVVINKIPPLRAAVATVRLPRHPVDGNCIIIRGVKFPYSVWVAICLNQKPYEAYLIQRQGASTLPRVGLKVLSNLYIPLPPETDVSMLRRQVWEWNEEALDNNESLLRLVAEVEDYFVNEKQKLNDTEATSYQSLSTGRFFPAESVEDSLLPTHVEMSYKMQQLKRQLGWLSLEKLLSVHDISRKRLYDEAPERARYLKLSDISTDLSFSLPEESETVRSGRIFHQPLTSGEVLLSTLVTNPRVAFVDEIPSTKIYVTDHLERLRFRETPGAWALVLNTTAIRTQLEGMAMGSIQQFTHPANILQLRVPDVPLQLRQRWEKLLLRHHQRKRDLDQQWQVIWNKAQTLFNEVHHA
ncbi:hypothetical protein NIES4071_06810 [Calothrix sp. NIES-4071]|nr:hypothetical protein NIES4071_06810 [Calothrix sp. NIES-4071]BAZ55023.1 hypothetical protein NIES4105_06770 [Calothrix sp. NIES-4105]